MSVVIPGPGIARPNRYYKWDPRMLELASHVAEWSKDPSTKVGAVIVRPDWTIASVGFNGFPRRVIDRPGLYVDRDEKYPRVIHAELNAILTARDSLEGCTLYASEFPCAGCGGAAIQAGLSRVVSWRPRPDMLERWADAFRVTVSMFKEAGVEFYCYERESEKGGAGEAPQAS